MASEANKEGSLGTVIFPTFVSNREATFYGESKEWVVQNAASNLEKPDHRHEMVEALDLDHIEMR